MTVYSMDLADRHDFATLYRIKNGKKIIKYICLHIYQDLLWSFIQLLFAIQTRCVQVLFTWASVGRMAK